ncbi:MAG: hypothetical protein AB8F95_20855 [Bacteroidia bacterium]
MKKQDWLAADTLAQAVSDSSEVWPLAQVYRAYVFLQDKTPFHCVRTLEQALPDSTMSWPACRNWYLGLSRIQIGRLVDAHRILDSLPASYLSQKNQIIDILNPHTKDSLIAH